MASLGRESRVAPPPYSPNGGCPFVLFAPALAGECYPYLARRLFTDESPRGKAALREMLYGGGSLSIIQSFLVNFKNVTEILRDPLE
eukprot:9481110-Pyramimonas_sp.AAC.1